MLSQKQSYKRIPAADRKGLTALVVELCKSHFRRFPNDWGALMWYAKARIELAQYSEAEKTIRQAILLAKKETRKLRISFVEMAHLFDVKGNFRTAAVWYRRALQVEPTYGDGWIYLGHVAFKQGQLKQAEAHYRKAIKSPGSCRDEAYFNLGGVLLATRRYHEAIKCYHKALEIDANYGIAKKRLKDAELALQQKNL